MGRTASESNDRELSKAFKDHLEETRGQIQNLEQVFKNVGRRAQGEKCPGIDGIKEEHESFMEENEPTEILSDVFITGSAARTEHYEIAAYTGLINQARALGERDSATLLTENLRQEKEALKTVEAISKRILKATSKPAAKGSTAKRSMTSKSRSKVRAG